jgi:hypothetical protein
MFILNVTLVMRCISFWHIGLNTLIVLLCVRQTMQLNCKLLLLVKNTMLVLQRVSFAVMRG